MALIVLLIFPVTASYAQNMEHSVTTQPVTFKHGTSSKNMSGNADYAMSYVYTIEAKKGQNAEITLNSKRNLASFSLISPDSRTIEDAFSVHSWKGILPKSGQYQLVIVMNDETQIRVPYTLQISIR